MKLIKEDPQNTIPRTVCLRQISTFTSNIGAQQSQQMLEKRYSTDTDCLKLIKQPEKKVCKLV